MRIGNGEFHIGDCFDVMATITDQSVDMLLCDLPYGTTSNRWDAVIPFDKMWKEYNRICKGRVVLTAAQPFTSALVMSNPSGFSHSWTWIKPRPTGFQNAKRLPLRATEDVLVFGRGPYNPQGLRRIDRICKNSRSTGGGNVRDDILESSGKGKMRTAGASYVQEFTDYPKNILEFGLDEKTKLHPTQKPVALFEYLIRTYTEEGMTVLDNTAGSGTTAIAAENANRRWICIERDADYATKAIERIKGHAGHVELGSCQFDMFAA